MKLYMRLCRKLRKKIFKKSAFYSMTLVFILSFAFSFIPLKRLSAEEAPLPTCYVRFSVTGLNVYADPSMTGEPIAILPDNTYVQILLGPLDSLAKIRVFDTGLEGYVDMRYLKQLDAIVYDHDLYTYDEMVEDIILLQQRYPKLLQTKVTGQSADGRDLYELTLGNPSAPKHILVLAGIHAREHANPYLVMEQLEHCLTYYDSGTYHGKIYQELFNNVAVHIVPMVNPDGIALSQFGEIALRSPELIQVVRTCYAYDTAAGRTKSSYEHYLSRWKANARGVDLNRNFPTGFGANAKALQPSYMGYEGIAPLSEPEILSLGAVTLLYRPSVVINYHSMGEVAYWDTVESKYTGINIEFSNYMLSLVPYKRMGRGSASGSYLDWIYNNETPVCSITFETGHVDCPFSLDQYPQIWLQHSLVVQAAAEYAYTH